MGYQTPMPGKNPLPPPLKMNNQRIKGARDDSDPEYLENYFFLELFYQNAQTQVLVAFPYAQILGIKNEIRQGPET